MIPITSNKTAVGSVILHNSKTTGFVLRTVRGVQAYTHDERVIGLYPTEAEAVAAILEKAAAKR